MKKQLKQLLSALTAAVLLVGLFPTSNVFAEETTDNAVIEQISDMVGSETEVVVDSSEGTITIETDVSFDEEVFDLSEQELQAIDEAAVSQEDSNAEPIAVTDANVSLIFNYETNETIIKSTETDQEGKEITNEFNVVIDNATEESGIQAEFIDTDTGDVYKVDSEGVEASIVWFAIPIGVAIGEALIAHLISIGLAMVLSGVTYLAISEFLKRPKNYTHYMAYIDRAGKFWVGNGLSRSKAVSRLKSGNSTWSTSSSNASSIAKEASPLGKAVGAEIDGGNRSGKLYHYHPVIGYKSGKSVRLEGAHAFFGSPQ